MSFSSEHGAPNSRSLRPQHLSASAEQLSVAAEELGAAPLSQLPAPFGAERIDTSVGSIETVEVMRLNSKANIRSIRPGTLCGVKTTSVVGIVCGE